MKEFKYLGHIINEAFRDDEDIERERRNLAIRGNILIRKYGYCSDETKCLLFRSFCYQLYTCALWTRYKKSTLDRLRVCYNKIMRQLVGLPPWHSASNMFVGLGVRSFQETQRILIYSLYDRVNNSANIILENLRVSDAFAMSNVMRNWNTLLCANRENFLCVSCFMWFDAEIKFIMIINNIINTVELKSLNLLIL